VGRGQASFRCGLMSVRREAASRVTIYCSHQRQSRAAGVHLGQCRHISMSKLGSITSRARVKGYTEAAPGGPSDRIHSKGGAFDRAARGSTLDSWPAQTPAGVSPCSLSHPCPLEGGWERVPHLCSVHDELVVRVVCGRGGGWRCGWSGGSSGGVRRGGESAAGRGLAAVQLLGEHLGVALRLREQEVQVLVQHLLLFHLRTSDGTWARRGRGGCWCNWVWRRTPTTMEEHRRRWSWCG
jgi:hypothetical protein